MTRITKELIRLQQNRTPLLEKLLTASRAAAAQMKDAGMHAGSAPLFELLFELDGIASEIDALLRSASVAERSETLLDILREVRGE